MSDEPPKPSESIFDGLARQANTAGDTITNLANAVKKAADAFKRLGKPK